MSTSGGEDVLTVLDGALPNPVVGIFGTRTAPRLDEPLESETNRVKIVLVTDGDDANRPSGEGFAIEFMEGEYGF